MGDYSVYAGVVAYAKQALIAFAQSSKVAIFNDPTNQVLSVKGKETQIREVRTAGLGDYAGKFGDGIGNAESVGESYYAPYDRKFDASIDSLAEAQSFIEGARPTLNVVMDSVIKNHLAPEIDAAIISRYASQVWDGNVHQNNETGYQVDKTNIYDTLINIEKDIANAGYVGDIVTFISATANAALESALINRNGFANENVVIKRAMTKEVFADEDGNLQPLEIDIKARRINNLLIVPVPDDRMVGAILMLNGESVGQQNGGWLPYKNSNKFFTIDILAIPMPAAYANIRHIINNLFVPATLDLVDADVEIAEANKRLLGVMTLEKCGINQKQDGYDAHMRCVYGGDIFKIRRDACVLVRSAVGAVDQMPVPGKMEVLTPAADLTGASAATVDVKLAFEPLNAGGTIYVDSATTASATVTASTNLVEPTEGEDRRPYAQVTVTFGATAGSSKITVYGDSGKHIKIGEFTVTSTGA